MSVHCSVEVLSSYVDSELSESEKTVVESHLEECEECGARLGNLSGLVGQLRRLEEVAPPPTLGFEVARRVQLERGRVAWHSRLESGLGRVARQPLFAPLFALVIALGIMFYVFSLGVARQTSSGTRVVIGGSEPLVEPLIEPTEGPVEGPLEGPLEEDVGATKGADAPNASREVVQQSAERPSRGKHSAIEAEAETARALASVAAVAANPRLEESRRRAAVVTEIAGRRMALQDGVWLEEGVEERQPEETIDLALGGALPPGLEALRERPGIYWVLEPRGSTDAAAGAARGSSGQAPPEAPVGTRVDAALSKSGETIVLEVIVPEDEL